MYGQPWMWPTPGNFPQPPEPPPGLDQEAMDSQFMSQPGLDHAELMEQQTAYIEHLTAHLTLPQMHFMQDLQPMPQYPYMQPYYCWNGMPDQGQAESPSGVRGRVWDLAKQEHGCRQVQTVLEEAENNDDKVALAWELRGHVWEAIRCKHANHVLAVCIKTLPPKDVQFIIDELVQAGEGSVSRVARHPYGCRILQRLFDHCPGDQVNILVEQMLGDVAALFKHKYAHYVIQKLLHHESDTYRDRITEALKKTPASTGLAKKTPLKQPLDSIDAGDRSNLAGHVWEYARDAKGCWLVQDAFANAQSDSEKKDLAFELEGHVWEALRCPNANHVLQKCISTLRPQDCQFIIDELQNEAGSIHKAARHMNGCRILKCLLDHCSPLVGNIVEELLKDEEVVKLCRHKYANFVMQHLLGHGTDEQKERLRNILMDEVGEVAVDSFGCAVLQKALDGTTDQPAFARLILQRVGLADSACSRHGHVLVEKALEVADEPSRREALASLLQQTDKLKQSRYGRAVRTFVDDRYNENAQHSG